VRDARTESRKERRARRNRELAGRTQTLIEAFVRIAAATTVDACAFVLWNFATRSPVRLVRDVVAGARRPGTLLRGTIVVVIGLWLVFGAASLLVPLVNRAPAFLVLETWTVVTGLLVEQLIGEVIWARLNAGRPRA
jgi:hypothetical protein